ncbi:MAG: dienelactone hydrolase family protein [Ktedonobacterales bacterium]
MPRPQNAPAPDGSGGDSVTVLAGWVSLDGDLLLPQGTHSIVLFAHGSGSSRHSPRNQMVARALNAQGLGTLLMDMLTPREEAEELQGAHRRFDIDLLTDRLVQTIDWLTVEPRTSGLSTGLFGASTGAAGALRAAAMRPEVVRAVVSRGGRPDLAGAALDAVRAPTLLLVGGNDTQVIALNRQAYDALHCEKRLGIVPGATHLFEEPGTLEEVAQVAADWFQRYLAPDAPQSPRVNQSEASSQQP